jgi:hypothetical protein
MLKLKILNYNTDYLVCIEQVFLTIQISEKISLVTSGGRIINYLLLTNLSFPPVLTILPA